MNSSMRWMRALLCAGDRGIKMKEIEFCLSLILFSAMAVFGQTAAEKVKNTAEFFVSAYNAKDYAKIERQFNAQMKAAVSGDKLKEFLDNLRADLGNITNLGAPDFIAPSAANFPAEFERGKMTLLVALDAEGKIAGFRVTPPEPPKPKNASRNQTKLSLPFKGEWFVVWGGDAPEQNQHQNAPNQRFAFDILKIGAGGKTHAGDGTKNEDFYAFGQEIVAPADGVVTYAVDGVQDNKPGEMNRMYVPGNLVVIKHAEGEYSLLAHLKQNSVRVRVGDARADPAAGDDRHTVRQMHPRGRSVCTHQPVGVDHDRGVLDRGLRTARPQRSAYDETAGSHRCGGVGSGS